MTDLATKLISDDFFIQRDPAPLPSAIRLREERAAEEEANTRKWGKAEEELSQEGVTPDRRNRESTREPPSPVSFFFWQLCVRRGRQDEREGDGRKEGEKSVV